MKNLYSIFDKVVGEFSPPFPASGHVHAIRMFQKGLSDTQFPEDFRLYHVGYFSTKDGLIVQDLDGDDNPHEIDTSDVFQEILKAKEGK